MATNGISVVFGGGSFWRGTVDEISSWLDVLEKAGIKKIDTAEVYGQSQYLLGKAGAPSRFIIDSKAVSGMGPNPSTAEVILEAGRKSLELLGTDSVSSYSLCHHYDIFLRPESDRQHLNPLLNLTLNSLTCITFTLRTRGSPGKTL